MKQKNRGDPMRSPVNIPKGENKMYNVKLLNKIAKCGTSIFDKATYNVGEEVTNAEAIMVRSASMHEMEFDKELLAIARAGAGVNNIPLDKCSDEGIVVFNTPGANANGVKELAIAALLLSSCGKTDETTGEGTGTTDTTITFNSQQNISKFEIQPKNWNDGIQVLAIAITTADGKQYVYRFPKIRHRLLSVGPAADQPPQRKRSAV